VLAHYQLSAALPRASQQQVLTAKTGISLATTLRFNRMHNPQFRLCSSERQTEVQGKVGSEGIALISDLSYPLMVVHAYQKLYSKTHACSLAFSCNAAQHTVNASISPRLSLVGS